MKFDTRKISQAAGFTILRISALAIVLILAYLIYDIASKGAAVINLDFILTKPSNGMTEGGIWPAITGTFWVSLVTVVFSVPVGMFTAIYLNEYASQGRIIRIIISGYRAFGVILGAHPGAAYPALDYYRQ